MMRRRLAPDEPITSGPLRAKLDNMRTAAYIVAISRVGTVTQLRRMYA